MADGGSGKAVKLAVVAVGLLVGIGSLVWYFTSGAGSANSALPVEPVGTGGGSVAPSEPIPEPIRMPKAPTPLK